MTTLAYSTDTVYIDQKHRIRLVWSDPHHWRSYTLEGDYIESLSGDDVREWLADTEYEFQPSD